MLGGWYAQIRKANSEAKLLGAYRSLHQSVTFLTMIPVLEFDTAALHKCLTLKSHGLRIGTNDLRIASIAMTRNATLVTRNLRDFGQIAGLAVEDWTI